MNSLTTSLQQKAWIIVLGILFLGQAAWAQNPSSGINFGIKAGVSKMNTEITSDFSQHLTEFDHKPGLALDLEFSKFLFKHFEVGTSINFNILKGSTDSASFTAINTASNQLKDIDSGSAVEYHNRLLGQRFFVGYYFRNFERINRLHSLEPFLQAGLGYINYAFEVKHPDEEDAIFGKGTSSFAQNEDVSLSTAIYFFTAGVKTYVSSNFFVTANYTINYVPHDFLDGVSNYQADGSRAGMNGLFSEFKIGFFFQTTGKGKQIGGRKHYSRPYLPFKK